ncbi:MAG TPA: hypothetical protein VMW42_00260 [Desulfatiglandales bacterium]|nr:hypothetical protein [Desulfatiglandales bacterium]
MQLLLLMFLGIVLLIFCVVDLYHLRQMLKTMRMMAVLLDGLNTKEGK